MTEKLRGCKYCGRTDAEVVLLKDGHEWKCMYIGPGKNCSRFTRYEIFRGDCSGGQIIYQIVDDTGKERRIVCHFDDLENPSAKQDCKKMCDWMNTRPIEDALTAEVDRLRGLVREHLQSYIEHLNELKDFRLPVPMDEGHLPFGVIDYNMMDFKIAEMNEELAELEVDHE